MKHAYLASLALVLRMQLIAIALATPTPGLSQEGKAVEWAKNGSGETGELSLDDYLALHEIQDVAKPTDVPSVSSGSAGRGSARFTPTQCQLLTAQIAEYKRVLPAYEAIGEGEAFRQALQVNQAAYDEGCQ